jgi:hypothetical protein
MQQQCNSTPRFQAVCAPSKAEEKQVRICAEQRQVRVCIEQGQVRVCVEQREVRVCAITLPFEDLADAMN